MERFVEDANFIMRHHRGWIPIDMKGCVLYLPFWRYGANQSKIWDQSGQHNDGIITGTVPEGIGWAFNGVDTQLEIVDGFTNVFSGNQAFSFLIWLYLRAPNGIIYSRKNDGGLFYMYIPSNNTIQFYVSGAINSTTVLSLNRWYNIVGLRMGASNLAKIYINGTEESSYTGGGQSAVPTATDNLYIGRYYDGTLRLNSSIGEVLTFNRTLSTQEIQSYYGNTRHIYGV